MFRINLRFFMAVTFWIDSPKLVEFQNRINKAFALFFYTEYFEIRVLKNTFLDKYKIKFTADAAH